MATKKTTTATTTKATPVKKKTSPKKKITADDIRLRAQQIYHQRVNSGQNGDELSDWLEAEKELTNIR